jgi:hypothetical protein
LIPSPFHGEADHLPRNGDPRAAERALAEDLPIRLGVTPTFISVAEQGDLIMKKLYKGTFYNIMVGKYFKDSKKLRADPKATS